MNVLLVRLFRSENIALRAEKSEQVHSVLISIFFVHEHTIVEYYWREVVMYGMNNNHGSSKHTQELACLIVECSLFLLSIGYNALRRFDRLDRENIRTEN